MRAGDVFLAYPGAQADGRRFIAQAIENGAAAVLWEGRDYALSGPLAVTDMPVEDLRGLSGWLAHLVYGRPSEALWMVGVTGTNGKTTVSQWLAQCFEAMGRRSAVIGTLGSGFPGALAQSVNTTPDAIALHRDLARYRRQGAQAAVMEVSSIGLDQGRVNGVAFDVAVFTNLTRDHLEYHGSMDAYAAAKARLFDAAGLAHAVLNLDDAFGREIARRLRGNAMQRIGYTLQAASERGGRRRRLCRTGYRGHGARSGISPSSRRKASTPSRCRWSAVSTSPICSPCWPRCGRRASRWATPCRI